MRFACVSYIPFFRLMRHNLSAMRLILSLLATFPFIALAQLPVSQAPEYKRVILEEFTAYRCGFCPSGHELANDIEVALGDENVIQVGYHSGSLAMPFSPVEPDFRTADGDVLYSFFGVSGTPSAAVNRENFGNSSFPLAAGTWLTNATAEHAVVADANIAMEVDIASGTRTALIDIEIFYTTPGSGDHYLTVGYSQNGIIAPQTTYSPSYNPDYFNPDGTYRHQHVFRAFVTDREGVAIDATSTNVISEHFEIGIPYEQEDIAINLDSLEFFAILHKGENGVSNSEVINVVDARPEVSLNTLEIANTNYTAYPNPSEGNFYINDLNDGTDLLVIDQLGKQVNFEQNGDQIILPHKGVNTILIKSEKGTTPIKIIVQ
jgi:hypothetical protein